MYHLAAAPVRFVQKVRDELNHQCMNWRSTRGDMSSCGLVDPPLLFPRTLDNHSESWTKLESSMVNEEWDHS